jgi:hypothetical protein
MASQPVQTKGASKPGVRSQQPPRPRAADRAHELVDLADPRLLPTELRRKVDPAVVVASLEAQIEEIRAGRAVGTDGDAFFAEWGQELKRLGA